MIPYLQITHLPHSSNKPSRTHEVDHHGGTIRLLMAPFRQNEQAECSKALGEGIKPDYRPSEKIEITS